MDLGKLVYTVLRGILYIGLIAAILLLILLACGGCGNAKTTTANNPRQYDDRMKLIGRSWSGAKETAVNDIYIWVDTETGVCYIAKYEGGITVMVDRDGKPYVANGWRDYDE